MTEAPAAGAPAAVTLAVDAPPAGTIERWAWDYVATTDLDAKLAPDAPSMIWEEAAPARRVAAPGRPPSLVQATRAPKTPGPEALRDPSKRAHVVHTFLHHELQAAELMAWAVLAFPGTPRAFRRGLLQILRDEVRHMRAYQAHLATLGHAFGDFPVRDWFWQRVPRSPTAAHFVAVMGVGFEGGNLDHAARYAERFRAIGDDRGADLQDQICAEEVPHVAFARSWFERFTGEGDFGTWVRHLPPPLSPILMRGDPLNVRDRARAGLTPAFIDDLRAYQPDPARP